MSKTFAFLVAILVLAGALQAQNMECMDKEYLTWLNIECGACVKARWTEDYLNIKNRIYRLYLGKRKSLTCLECAPRYKLSHFLPDLELKPETKSPQIIPQKDARGRRFNIFRGRYSFDAEDIGQFWCIPPRKDDEDDDLDD